MSDGSTVLTDSSKFSRSDLLLYKFEYALTLIGGVVIFLLVMLATTNILGRWFLNMPVDGFIDWVEQAMAFFAFLGLSYTQRDGGHIRMDIIISRLHGRWLWGTELLSTLLMLGITLILIYGSSLHFLRAYQIGDSSLDIDLPTWPAKLVVPVALSLFALRLLLQIWGYARAFRNRQDEPVGVPLILNPAQIAKLESELALGERE